jgi:hypothetical protein
MSKMQISVASLTACVAMSASAQYFENFSTSWLPSGAQAGTLAGTVDGQNGWTTRDAFTSATTVGKWDQQVMNVNDANGNRKVFRMSNAITSGTYASQVFSAKSGQVAGESNAALWNDRGLVGSSPTPLQYGAYASSNTFYSKLAFRSATGAAQTGLALTLSPSAKQATVRMSYVQIADTGSGFDLRFYETLGDGAFPTAFTTIASGLSYAALHTLEIGMTFVDGLTTGGDGKVYGNDIVKIYLNGSLIHSGTSWESYYAKYEQITAGQRRIQAVDSMLFRVSGTAATGTSGNGFYFEDFAIGNTIVPAPGAAALVAMAGLMARRRRG